VWAGLYFVALAFLIGLAVAFGWVFWVVAACALAAAVGAASVYLLGSMWWYTGAGEPVLVVRDGVVHGRIRPVAKGGPAGPTVAGWWDFVVPLPEVSSVRLTGSGRPAVLSLHLPDETSQKLVAAPETAWYAKRWLARAGSPAVWPVGRMLRRPGRGPRLAQLLAELQSASGQPA
jgi:hypothetical protein